MNFCDLATYQYELPQELIAQKPCEPRDHSRLLIVDRQTGEMREERFSSIADLLEKGDQLIVNNTKVIPARLFGKKKSGASVELLLLRQKELGVWEALARPAKKLPVGTEILIGEGFSCEVIEEGDEGVRVVSFCQPERFWENVNRFGHLPLPHYIHREGDDPQDQKNYQTVFAKEAGAVAAPTAGLHFTDSLLEGLKKKGVDKEEVTLHVGLGTFRPVQVDDIREHQMHHEVCSVSEKAARHMNNCSGKQICVGTTCCRTVESASNDEGRILAGEYDTNLFIYPGYRFKFTKQLLTNFHLPGSTLLMLVCAFGGYELVMEAYRYAIKERLRFFSYGDAMLLL